MRPQLRACRFAGIPTSRSPLSEKATMEGVVRAPSAFSMTLAVCVGVRVSHAQCGGRGETLRRARLALHHGNAAVGGAQVDADNLAAALGAAEEAKSSGDSRAAATRPPGLHNHGRRTAPGLGSHAPRRA